MPASTRERLLDVKRRVTAWHGHWLRIAIECARGPASIALDQMHLDQVDMNYMMDDRVVRRPLIEDPWKIQSMSPDERRWRRDIEYMIHTLALADYKLRYPRARGDRLWVFKGTHKGGDIHCRFCSLPLQARARIGVDYSHTATVREHTRQCALESLAGLRTPSGPIATKAGRS